MAKVKKVTLSYSPAQIQVELGTEQPGVLREKLLTKALRDKNKQLTDPVKATITKQNDSMLDKIFGVERDADGKIARVERPVGGVNITEISDAQMDELASGNVTHFEDIFRLTATSRERYSVRDVATAFVEERVSRLQGASVEELKELLFEPVLNDKGKPVIENGQVVYKLKDEYKWLQEQGYISEANVKTRTISYQDLVVKNGERLAEQPIKTFQQTLYKEMNFAALPPDSPLRIFLTDPLDKDGLAVEYGVDLMEYGKYVDVPVSVLALHAVVTTKGLLDCFASTASGEGFVFKKDGKASDDKSRRKYAEIIKNLRASGKNKLADLIENLTGYKVVGDKVENIAPEEDKFKDIRSDLSSGLLKAGIRNIYKNAALSEAEITDCKQLIAFTQVLESHGIYQNPDRQQLEEITEDWVQTFVDSIPADDKQIFFTREQAQNMTARMAYFDSAITYRREEVIDDVAGTDLFALNEAERASVIAATYGKPPVILGQEGIIVRNLALLEQKQTELKTDLISTHLTPDQKRERIREYQETERTIVEFNGIAMEVAESFDKAEVLFDMAGIIKKKEVDSVIDKSADIEAKKREIVESKGKITQLDKTVLDAENKVVEDRKLYYMASLSGSVLSHAFKMFVIEDNAQNRKKCESILAKALKQLKGFKFEKDDNDKITNFDQFEEAYKKACETMFMDVAREFGKSTEYINPRAIENAVADTDTEWTRLSGLNKDKLVEERNLITSIPEANRTQEQIQKLKLINSLIVTHESRAELAAEKQNLVKLSKELQGLVLSSESGVQNLKFEDIIKKITCLGELLKRLKVCKQQLSDIDLSKFEKLEGFEILQKQREEYGKTIDNHIKAVERDIEKYKNDLRKQPNIVEVKVDGTDQTRFVIIDNPQRQIEIQQEGYEYTTGLGRRKKDQHGSFAEDEYVISPLTLEIVEIRKKLMDPTTAEPERQAARERLTQIKESIDEMEPTEKTAVLEDVVRLERYAEIQTKLGTGEPKNVLTEEDVRGMVVYPTPNTYTEAEMGAYTAVVEETLTTGEYKAIPFAGGVPEAEDEEEEEYTVDKAKEEANVIINETPVFADMKAAGTLDAYIEKVTKLIEKITAIKDKDAELPGIIAQLTARKELAEKAKTPVAEEEVRDESVPPVVEEEKTPRDVVIEKIKAITIPENIATMTDKEALNNFVRDAEALCQELNDNAEWRGVLAAEELPEYKTLTEALAAAKERVTALSAEAGGRGEEIPPVAPVVTTPEYTEEDVHAFVDNYDRIMLIQHYAEATTPEAKKKILLDLGYDESEIDADGNLPPTDTRVRASHNESVRILKETVSPKVPRTGAEREKFLDDAVEYEVSISDEPVDETRREEIRRDYSAGIDGLDRLEEVTIEEDSHEDEEERDFGDLEGGNKKSIPSPKKPRSTVKGIELALKSTKKLIENLDKIKVENKAKAEYVAAQTKTSLLEQAYTKLLFNAMNAELGPMIAGVNAADVEAYEGAEYAEDGTTPQFDAYIALKYLDGVANKCVIDPETGQLGIPVVTTDPETGKEVTTYKYVQEAIFESIETVNAHTEKSKTKINRRQKALHKHLHTIATREAILAGAKKLEEFCVANNIEITAENLSALVAGTYVKKGAEGEADTPIVLSSDIVNAATVAVRNALGRGDERE